MKSQNRLLIDAARAKLGLRVLTLTHSRRNYAADGSFILNRKTGKPGGLTTFGIALLKKADDLARASRLKR